MLNVLNNFEAVKGISKKVTFLEMIQGIISHFETHLGGTLKKHKIDLMDFLFNFLQPQSVSLPQTISTWLMRLVFKNVPMEIFQEIT